MFYGRRCCCGRYSRKTMKTCKSSRTCRSFKSCKTMKTCKTMKSYRTMKSFKSYRDGKSWGCREMYEDKKGCGCYATPIERDMTMMDNAPMHHMGMHVERMRPMKLERHMDHMMECEE